MEHTQIKYILDDGIHLIDIKGFTVKQVESIIKFLEVNKIYEFEYIMGETE